MRLNSLQSTLETPYAQTRNNMVKNIKALKQAKSSSWCEIALQQPIDTLLKTSSIAQTSSEKSMMES